MKTLAFAIEVALGILVPFLWQAWDRRRLPRDAVERAWNTASWGAALYAFGAMSMLGWFWVTRRGPMRVVGGIASTLAVVATLLLLEHLVALSLGLRREPPWQVLLA